MTSDPLMVPQILSRVGPAAMADWLLHLLGLAAFTFLHWDAQASRLREDRGRLVNGG